MSIRSLHVVDSLEPDAGSVATLLPGLWAALAGNEADVTVLTAKPSNDAVTPVSVDVVNPAAGDRIRAAVAAADLVHIHGIRTPLAVAAAKIARRAGVPYIISPYAYLSDNPKPTRKQRLADFFSDKQFLRDAAALHAVSKREADYLCEARYHNRAICAPLGIDADDWSHRAEDDSLLPDTLALTDRRLMLYLGRVAHPMEGLVPWLKACYQLSDDITDWHVVLAGPVHQAWRDALEAGLRRSDSSDRITILDSPSLGQQRALLNRAALLVAPSVRDNVPVSVLQALAVGVPVVASERLALDEMDDLDAVRRVAPNRKTFLGALADMVDQSPEQLKSNGQAAKAAAASRFDWAHRIPAYLAMYQAVVPR